MWIERPLAWQKFYEGEKLERYLSKMYYTLNVKAVNRKLKKYDAVYEYDRSEARVIFAKQSGHFWFMLKWS